MVGSRSPPRRCPFSSRPLWGTERALPQSSRGSLPRGEIAAGWEDGLETGTGTGRARSCPATGIRGPGSILYPLPLRSRNRSRVGSTRFRAPARHPSVFRYRGDQLGTALTCVFNRVSVFQFLAGISFPEALESSLGGRSSCSSSSPRQVRSGCSGREKLPGSCPS